MDPTKQSSRSIVVCFRTKRGQERGHGRPNGVFLMMMIGAAAPRLLRGRQDEAKRGQMRGHERPHGPNKTELSFDSGVPSRLRSPSPRSSSAYHAYLLWFRVLSMNLSRHRPPRRRHHRHQHGHYHHRLRHRHAASGLGLRAEGVGFRAYCLGFTVWVLGLGLMFQGLGFRV